ncbi:hypothetical protein IVB16_38885 (plasmid) [Bradyrhizobium sp. 183]|uniref:hypothetical protein n=1 Tax=unclassified Bradyrhizobium TaxID=2631580 RepID=UPI001FFAF059|nr:MULTISPECIES: hypothetical protein [unclassified Bradyrhizobium]MCK1348635.1 hypothetical protein [Bradyrhizobium sp. CW11]MCK1570084.1 hypothetical protein [Bradyrhizobium sp. 173]UPJ84670.1 hypothetical protein IVB17_41130 [Bradyrhizobium sp. 184]UPJ92511.1 hypothetical protein IVB16_38885 [Bradyrhizobium sp. 183]
MTEADFVLEHAEPLLTVATRCAWSFGAADGLDQVLERHVVPRGAWRHPIAILQRDAMLMAVTRVVILLDRSKGAVSFQTLYHQLKEPEVQAGVLAAVEERRGPELLEPERANRIAEFLAAYRTIDWGMHGRLKHFRNLDIAHLREQARSKSITMQELRTLVGVVTSLAVSLQALLQTGVPFHSHLAEEARNEVEGVVSTSRAIDASFPLDLGDDHDDPRGEI